VKLVKRIINQ